MTSWSYSSHWLASFPVTPHILYNRQTTGVASQGPLDDDQAHNINIVHPIIAKDKSQVKFNEELDKGPGLNAWLQCQLTLLLVDYINNS